MTPEKMMRSVYVRHEKQTYRDSVVMSSLSVPEGCVLCLSPSPDMPLGLSEEEALRWMVANNRIVLMRGVSP